MFGVLNQRKGLLCGGVLWGDGSTHYTPWKILGRLFVSPPNTMRCALAGGDARDGPWEVMPRGQEEGLAQSACPTLSPPPLPPGSTLPWKGGEKYPSYHLLLKCSCGCFQNFSSVNSMCLSLRLCPVHWPLPSVLRLLRPGQEQKALILSLQRPRQSKVF